MRSRWTVPGLMIAAVVAMPLGACSSDGPKKTTSKAPRGEPVVTKPASGGISQPTPVELPQAMSRVQRAELREQALGLLVNTAQAGAPEERANAIEALTKTPARLSMVLDSALQDQNTGVRAVAALAIGKAKQTTFIPRVKPLLQDPSPFVSSAAMFALHKCGVEVDLTPLATMLQDPSPRVRAQAAFILGEIGEKSALGLLREAARQSPSRANPAEIKVLDLQIAEARVKLGEEAAIADIRSALYPSRPEDLEAAIFAMWITGSLKDRASVNRLIQLTAPLDESKQPMPGEIRMAAAMALAKLGQPEGSYIAREYFAGANEALRAQSAHLFGETNRPENLHILARMMNDPDGRVRVAAASAIVRVTESESRNAG